MNKDIIPTILTIEDKIAKIKLVYEKDNLLKINANIGAIAKTK
jgi:hypothetical protein